MNHLYHMNHESPFFCQTKAGGFVLVHRKKPVDSAPGPCLIIIRLEASVYQSFLGTTHLQQKGAYFCHAGPFCCPLVAIKESIKESIKQRLALCLRQYLL